MRSFLRRASGTVPSLTHLLGSRFPTVRAAGLRRLARTSSDPLLVERVRDALRADPSAVVRAHAATTLGRLNGSTADDALLLALSDPDERVRRAAAFALAPSGDPRALAAVVDGLHSDDPVLRDATALALSDLDPDQMARIQLLLQARAGSRMETPPA